MHAHLSFSEDLQSSFHYRGGPVKLVQASLCAGKTCTVKNVQACLLVSQESSFHALLWMSYEARASLFRCGKDLRKPF